MIHDPDAIVVLSSGTVPDKKAIDGRYRSTTYAEKDAYGTLGGRVRIDAAVMLARKYPDAIFITTSRRMGGGPPTHASVQARELIECGVDRERIILEEHSTASSSQVAEALKLAEGKKWKEILFLTSEYHVPRIKAFYEHEHSSVIAKFLSAESVLAEHDQEFAKKYDGIKQTPAYKLRVESEVRGVEAIKKGAYTSALRESKKERKV